MSSGIANVYKAANCLEIMLCVHNVQISEQSSSRFLSNLKVVLISKVHSRFLAKERTDSVCSVGGKLLGFSHKRQNINKH